MATKNKQPRIKSSRIERLVRIWRKRAVYLEKKADQFTKPETKAAVQQGIILYRLVADELEAVLEGPTKAAARKAGLQ